MCFGLHSKLLGAPEQFSACEQKPFFSREYEINLLRILMKGVVVENDTRERWVAVNLVLKCVVDVRDGYFPAAVKRRILLEEAFGIC